MQGLRREHVNSLPDIIHLVSDSDTDFASEQTLCHRESGPQGNVLNLDPLGNGRDNLDPQDGCASL